VKQHYHSELMRVCNLWSCAMNCNQKIKHISLSAYLTVYLRINTHRLNKHMEHHISGWMSVWNVAPLCWHYL